MKGYFSSCIDYFKLGGYNFHNIKELVIKTPNDRCNISHQITTNASR